MGTLTLELDKALRWKSRAQVLKVGSYQWAKVTDEPRRGGQGTESIYYTGKVKVVAP